MWFTALFALLLCDAETQIARFDIEPVRSYRVGDLPIDLRVKALNQAGDPVTAYCGSASVRGLEQVEKGVATLLTETPPFSNGEVLLSSVRVVADVAEVELADARGSFRDELRVIPGALSLLPPILAVLLAILLREALLALLAGVWVGALLVYDYQPLTALLRTFDTHIPAQIADSSHASILVFTMALGGMVGVMSRSGGTRALVDVMSSRVRSRRSGLIASWAAGLVIFFDDYSNCLLVGNTLRPFTDKLKVSREKLAFVVDATAAPIATIALVSTWIGYQLGLLQSLFEEPAYELFLGLLPYSFYSFFTIAFVFLVAYSQRDFGPMLAAERRAISGGGVSRPGAAPLMEDTLTDMETASGARPHWLAAAVPVASVIAIVALGLYVSGSAATPVQDPTLRDIIGAADSYAVLLWASFGGGIVAMAAAVLTRSLSFTKAMHAWFAGVKAMLLALMILVLAWSIGTMCQNYLQTGPWVLTRFAPSPHLLPILTFLLCSAIAFATGTSYGTMAIVLPIAGPLAWTLTGDGSGLEPSVVESIRFATLAAILGGSVLGDHCSPISDTTIMSSMASACDHIDHVRTQIPYAGTCGLVAATVGFLPAGWGVPPYVSIPVGIAALAALLYGIGRKAEAAASPEREP